MGRLLSTPDFRLAVVTKAGLRILLTLEDIATALSSDVVLTAGTNGTHSGPDDPHILGNAFDVRLLDRSTAAKSTLVALLAERLGPAFTCLHEMPGATPQTTAEHLHVQLKKGLSLPLLEVVKPLEAP